MEITPKRIGGTLEILLKGELDHHSARRVIPEIGSIIDLELPMRLILDFSGIGFMDSSGIAVVIGSYKKVFSSGGEFEVVNVPKQAYKVFSAAGICKLIKITKQDKQALSV